MGKFSKLFYITAGALITLLFIFASWHLFNGEVLFHTDLARDALIVEEMVETKRPDLIGPRAGGIPGLFFGPIWYYAMIPFFIIGNGNPIAIGIFWMMMVILSLASTWYVSTKIFGKETGLLTAVLYSAVIMPIAIGFTQSFGSLILSPLIFYLLFILYQNPKIKHLIALIFLLGILFHLQPAFAMLMIVMSFFFCVYILKKANKLHNIFYFLLIIIPLGNYLLFEVRHNFLQIQAFFNFLTNPPSSRNEITILETITNRLDGFMARLSLIKNINRIIAYLLTFFLNTFIFYKAITDKKLKARSFYIIFFIFYISFWFLTFLFKGLVWDFYHWGFLPLVVMIFSSIYQLIPKKIFFIIYLLVLIPTFTNGTKAVMVREDSLSKENSSSWKLNQKVAKNIFQKADGEEFGYYVYSPDEFGFSIKYALNYLQQSYPNQGMLCMKKEKTFLIYYPTPEVGAVTDPRYWREERVGINSNPESREKFGEIEVEEYKLEKEELLIASDPNIICDLTFR